MARVAIIGAGIAGLTAALDLSRQGFEVRVLDQNAAPGGKIREVQVAGRFMDAGPTVFTLRDVFDQLFDDAGTSIEQHLKLIPAQVLARHAWRTGGTLDLYADLQRSSDAIGLLAGPDDARNFLKFSEHAKEIYRTLEESFIRVSRPSPLDLVRRVGIRGLGGLWNIDPFATLWQSLNRYFSDPRLRQLFGRYATYCGSSPFQSPATLMLVAHVEQAGVWYIEGGMHRLAATLARLAAARGTSFAYNATATRIVIERGRIAAVETAAGERFAADAIVCNADNHALASGLLGAAAARAAAPTSMQDRSLSAVTWNLVAHTQGFPLARHNVFFSADYQAEFDDIFRRRRLPAAPTVYVCAQDRYDGDAEMRDGEERLLCLVNAPAIGDIHTFGSAEIETCEMQTFELLRGCGLQVQRRPQNTLVTSPTDFHGLFPGTGGALYGPASHGWKASFARPGSRSRIPGLYLAGGSTHPGPGVPMAATSGRLAAACIVADRASIAKSRPVAMHGGTSMR